MVGAQTVFDYSGSPTTPKASKQAPSSPRTSPTSSLGKRKRTEENVKTEHADANGTITEADKSGFYDTLVDLETILRSYDTNLSILDRTLPSTGEEAKASKRTRNRRQAYTEVSEPTSITSKINRHTYSNFDELLHDIAIAVQQCESELKNSDADRSTLDNGDVVLPDPAVQMQQLHSFRQEITTLMQVGLSNQPQLFDKLWKRKPSQENQILALIVGVPDSQRVYATPRHKDYDVLATYLKDGEISPSVSALPSGFQLVNSQELQLPLRQSKDVEDAEKNRTFVEAFSSTNLPPLQPPQRPSATETKGTLVTWHDPTQPQALRKPRLKGDYITSTQAVCSFISYHNTPVGQEDDSLGVIRKQRDRALSTGESRPTLSEEEVWKQQCAKNEALSMSVFSSLGPTSDCSHSMIDPRRQAHIWFERAGRKAIRNPVQPIEAGSADEGDVPDDEFNSEAVLEAAFQETVDTWVREEPPWQRHEITKDDDQEKDVQELLDEVTDGLETLCSMQRARQMSLSKPLQSSAAPDPEVTALIGDAVTPSDSEFDLFETLRSQLVLLIGQLPSSVVSRLNGNLLEELSISTAIENPLPSVKGSMNLDATQHLTKPVAPPAMAPAATPRPAPRPTATQSRQDFYKDLRDYTMRSNRNQTNYGNSHFAPPRPSSGANQYGPYRSQYVTPTSNQPPTNGYRTYPNGYPTTPGPSRNTQTPSQPQYQQRAQSNATATPYNSAYGTSPPRTYTNGTPGTIGATFQMSDEERAEIMARRRAMEESLRKPGEELG